MAAPPPAVAFAPLVAAINAAFGGQVATQADLAPLATQANVNAQFAALQVSINAQLAAMQVQFAAMQAQLLAQIQAMLMPQNAPVIAIAVATSRAVFSARARNAHDLRGVAYVAVPRDDGTLPPNWPVGFDREDLVEGPIGVVDAILNDYGLQHGVPHGMFVRRNVLAAHIGTALA